jgi:MFS family permease
MPSFSLSARNLGVLCAASLSWAFSFGLGAPLASLWLRDQGWSDTVIGLNTGVYYLGIALAAALVPALMRRFSYGCPAAGMALSGITVACFPWGGSLTGWFVLRLVNGLAGAMSLIPLETCVNRHSPPEQRSRNFGCYAFAIALGWALGNLVGLQLYTDAPRAAFVLGGLGGLLAAAIIVGGIAWPAEPEEAPQERHSLELRWNFLSFGSAWSQGFLEGGMVAFLSVYLLFMAIPDVRVSWITSGIMIGVILFQVPVAWLADRVGRTTVLLGCYAATAVGLICLPVCGDSPWLVGWLFLVGACSGAFYPLGLAILGDRLPSPALTRASAWFLGINCCGSLVGPAVTGVLMDQFGRKAMFGSALAAVLGVVLVWFLTRLNNSRQHQPVSEIPPTPATERAA